MRRAEAFGLAALLLGSLALNAWGLGWGLPSRYGWAPDEVLPGDVIEARARGFSGGWHTKYPPLHFYLLAAMNAATPRDTALAAPRTSVSSARDVAASDAAYARLFVRARVLSLLMAVGVLFAVYAAARIVTTPRAAWFAAALTAGMPPFVFYAKLANVDMPSLFWWTLSLVFLLRALRDQRIADYALLGGTAAAAVATKDQMYGFYVLCVPWILLTHVRRVKGMDESAHRRTAFGLKMLAAGGTFAVLFVLLSGLPWNLAGFRAHVALIAGSASQDFQEFAGTTSGHFGLLVQTVANLAFTLGIPAFLLCLAGIGASVRGAVGFPRPAILLPALSYYAFFLMVVIYCYDRFVIGIGILLAFFGGALLDRIWEAPRMGLLARASAVAILLYGAGRCVSLDLAMVNDARYGAEAWLRTNAAPPAAIAPIGPLEYLPRMAGLEARPLGPSVDRLEKVKPRFVVTSADYAERSDPGTGAFALYAGLDDGSLGYRRVFDHRYEAPFLLLRTEDLLDRPGALVRSNIGKVNPRIRIYERETAP
jgi:hypothetical protein